MGALFEGQRSIPVRHGLPAPRPASLTSHPGLLAAHPGLLTARPRLVAAYPTLLAARGIPVDWGRVLREDLIPVISAYLVVLAMLAAYRRAGRELARRAAFDRTGTRPVPEGRPSWGSLCRHLLVTAVGGYLVFLTIVIAYYLGAGGENRLFVEQALREGSILAFGMVVPGFLLLSWLDDRLRSALAKRARRREARRGTDLRSEEEAGVHARP